MKIWYVDCDDLSCAWTKKEDAINYLKEEAKNCNWKIHFPFPKSITDEYMYVDVICTWEDPEFEESNTFHVGIYPIFLDEKPYF